MAQVHPFQAFRYNPQRVPFERVLTQPYDKISASMQDKYYAADPHNLIAVEKGRPYPTDSQQNNVYTRAAAALDGWIRENIVVQDPVPSFYAYTQEYTVPVPASSALAAVSSAPANSKTIPRASSFATSTPTPVPKPTASSFFATRALTPASFSCCTPIRRSASTRF
jgi:hypothetical protein